ncbi:hypothetical protein CDAR_115061 [Caerostris darwini]|uniref:Uncharacterized protein n=1 Tax=Caerostris darwini TaxID=1538125 RepID=A0AAV4P4L6_9ARAC|nr:hypothetical protein CDAR_115061 [Caerostris darwini]
MCLLRKRRKDPPDEDGFCLTTKHIQRKLKQILPVQSLQGRNFYASIGNINRIPELSSDSETTSRPPPIYFQSKKDWNLIADGNKFGPFPASRIRTDTQVPQAHQISQFQQPCTSFNDPQLDFSDIIEQLLKYFQNGMVAPSLFEDFSQCN